MRPYRCVNQECTPEGQATIGFDFVAREPKCPKCGADLRDPDSSDLILALQFVHLDIPGKWKKGTGRYACTREAFKNEPATGFANIVTCPACKLTKEWKESLASQGWEMVEEISAARAAELQAAAAIETRPKKPQEV